MAPTADGFLPDVEVAEAADLPQAVHLGCLLLEPSDEQHLAEELLLARGPAHGAPPPASKRTVSFLPCMGR